MVFAQFAHFSLESGKVFLGTTGVYERICRFNSKWIRKKEKYANLKFGYFDTGGYLRWREYFNY